MTAISTLPERARGPVGTDGPAPVLDVVIPVHNEERVDIVATAMADLRGIARLARGFATGAISVRQQRPDVQRGLMGQLLRFGAVGTVSTIVYLMLFLVLSGGLGAQGANLVALFVTAIANTAANRRLTFGVRGSAGAARHQFEGLIVFTLGLGFTSGSRWPCCMP